MPTLPGFFALLAAKPAALIPVADVLLRLSIALGLAVLVERVVEFLKNIENMLPSSASAGIPMSVISHANQEIEERKKFEDAAGHEDDVPHEFPLETILVQEATDPDDGTTIRSFAIQAVAVVVGIVAAHFSKLQLFHAFGASLAPETDYLLTGLFIGGGSGPVHLLIQFITERKIPATIEVPERAEIPVKIAAAAAEAETPDAAPGRVPVALASRVFAAPAPNIDGTLDIPYAGGVRRESLDAVHRRLANPTMIVLHHTAMPLNSSFEDLVRVIEKDRGWITGYNCTVTSDGVIHPFCRWDRYGNHAKGFNMQSLGISLNGNFETRPSVPCSNADGSYGPARPTEPQLDAAARVVALWLFVYPGIALEFEDDDRGIVPHRKISVDNPKKTCPGNMFPHASFEQLVHHYHEMWRVSQDAKDRIEAFKKRPYLYVDTRVPTTDWARAFPKPSGGVPAAAVPPFPSAHPAPIAGV